MVMRELAQGLRFPEGPVVAEDGALIFVEVAGGTLRRIGADGRLSVVAVLGGGPNGAAFGPDGALYVCNNGGLHWLHDAQGMRPHGPAADETGGSIQRVDVATGAFETLYDHVDGRPLVAPNDLVFDRHGGFWFTDFGKLRPAARTRDLGAVYYARADGSLIREAAYPFISPNGIALSPDEATLYVADTDAARVWAFDILAPGVLAKAPFPSPHGGRLLGTGGGALQRFDSMAVDAAGNVNVATLLHGGITVFSPDGSRCSHVPLPDAMTTNLCFGGQDMRTAYVTLSASGRVVALDWPQPGLRLNHQPA